MVFKDIEKLFGKLPRAKSILGDSGHPDLSTDSA
jgi:hypothetical protein